MKLLFFVAGFTAVSAQMIVDGGWSEWVDNGLCCGGFIQRVRTCTNPEPSGGGAVCSGPSELPFTCEIDNCQNDGWSDWSAAPCCYGTATRTRTCLAVRSDFCIGEASETESCTRADGSTDCFIANTQTGSCETPLSPDGSTLFETREECCSSEFAEADFDSCMGTPSAPTPSDGGSGGSGGSGGGDDDEEVVDGGWGAWTEYNSCCDNRQSRFRVCDNPRPSANGAPCEGSFREERACSPNVCGVQPDGETSSGAYRLVVQSMSAVLAALIVAFL